MSVNSNCDVIKEALVYIMYFEDELIDKIPDELFTKLRDIAADSTKDYYVDSEKSLENQEMSDDCKAFLTLVYYNFLATENEKIDLLVNWKNSL